MPTKKSQSDRQIPIAKDSTDFFMSPSGVDEGADFFSGEGQLSCDIWQDNENIYIRATMAGVKPEDLDISISNDLLTARGTRETGEEIDEKDFYSREIYWGAFSRSIVLPQTVDQEKAQATLKNGVLTVKLPKKYKTTSIRIKHLND